MTSSVLITLIALGIVGALAFFAAIGFRGSGKVSDYAPNLSKYRTDDDLETKTLDRTLTVAVLIASLLTIMIPLYYLGEQERQEGFVEEFDEVSVERGEHLYEEFGCGNCHGVDGSGGAASYVEKRWEAKRFFDLLELLLNDNKYHDNVFIVTAGPEDDFCQVFNELEKNTKAGFIISKERQI